MVAPLSLWQDAESEVRSNLSPFARPLHVAVTVVLHAWPHIALHFSKHSVLQPLIPHTSSNMSDTQPLQAFRSRLAPDHVADIPTLLDRKTGGRIVLWTDIKSVFEDAKTIWNGTSLVPFLTDENTFER